MLDIEEDRFIYCTQNYWREFNVGCRNVYELYRNIIYVCCFLNSGSKNITQTYV